MTILAMRETRPERQLRGVVPSTYVRLLYEYLARQGVDADALLGETAPEAADRGLVRYPVERWRTLLRRAADHLGDPLLGLHLGQTATPAHFGVMGYVLLACPQLGAALTRMQQYQRLLYDVNPMRSSIQGSDLLLEWGVDNGRPGALVDECAIAALLQFARNATGCRNIAAEVCFVNPAPADAGPYRDWFGCPVLFDREATTVRIPLALLALPLRQPDAILMRVLEQQADALLAELPPTDDFEQAVRRCVARLIRSGEPELERVANELHVSPRTLHRRLEAGGTNFRMLREDIRQRLAEHYLADPRLQLADIAQLLGYSEQSTFTRSFRRWTGLAPNSYRQQVLYLEQEE
ncbi:AraC family transcriptional regulator [Collimonas arenae]|uniref:AraC family transcriptional regulator n=1 Tax=Collimonas arenae TaxID=279058 RepID=UPI001E3F174C|nr:AraC family transcriptional regulator [Collimonas arenae]